MHRIRIAAVIAVFAAMPLLAADLGKFNDWPDSPQGYFMTKAERAEWSTLTSEAAAAKFVDDFLARRDPNFSAEVAKRAEMADKHLTVGKTPGSKSVRGKVIILFGPPSAMSVAAREKTSTKRDNPIMAGAITNTGSVSAGGGGRGNDNPTGTGASLSTTQGIRSYSITFSGDATTKTIDRKEVTFVIDADAVTGKDEFASRSAAREAEELFELVARASIVKK